MPVVSVDPDARDSVDEYEVIVETNREVCTRDGVKLATDVYRPALNGKVLGGPLPVVLQRTPYNKTEVEHEGGDACFFARHGYIAVMQDCRGCFVSGGDVNFLIPEAEDGADTVAWINQQTWCNGRIGTWGTSWAGWTQTALAALAPENLVTMIPNMSGSNAHESSVRQGGAMELRFIAWAFWHAASNSQSKLSADFAALNFGAPAFSEWLTRMPIRPGMTQLSLVLPYERWVFDLLTKADYDEFWMHPSLNPRAHYENMPDIPILWIGGWYDSYARGSFENFKDLTALKSSPQHLLMGPWVHGYTTMEEGHAGDVSFGPKAGLTSAPALHLRWFDRWMRGVDNGIDKEPRLQYFAMGGGDGRPDSNGRLMHGGEWRGAGAWPLEDTTTVAYYLHADGSLSVVAPGEIESSTTYRFDPGNPVPSCGGSVSSLSEIKPLGRGVSDPAYSSFEDRMREIMLAGAFDQVEREDMFGCSPPYLPIGSRADVLVFQTPPLEHCVEVTGPIEVELWVATSALDTDFTAKLIDVHPVSGYFPYGFAMNLTDSIMRLRYRNGPEGGELVEPDAIVPVTITLYPTSNRFIPGHRIRVDISSSNFPRFDVNPNTGERLGKDRLRVVAENTVFHDATHASRILLPIRDS